MQAFIKLITLASVGIPVALASGSMFQELETAGTIAIQRGTASFVVPTNMPGLTVKGKSEALEAHIQIRRAPDGVTLDRIEAFLPVKTLATGIAVRDHHMREYVFTAPSGEVPDLRFESDGVLCPGVQAGREAACNVAGTLTIRGVPRTFSMVLKIREAGGALAFRAGGDGLVRLSDYGIEPPSQFGVKTANEVQIHLDFPEATVTSATGHGQ
jgi:polyisoprenoid-binding protein YceI